MKQEKMVRKAMEGRKDVEQMRDPHLEGGFEKIEKDHQYLRQCLKEVLEEIGHGALTEYLELEKKPSRLRPGMGREVVQLLSLDFQLLNLVEENTANQTNRKRMNQQGSNAVSGSWPGYLKRLEGQFGKTSQLLDGMRATEVDIVLTAHPTESKKWSILDQHRELFLCLFQLENNLYTGFEREIIRDEIKGILERLWRTGEIPMEKPDISAERRNILYYLREKLPQAVRLHDQWLMQHLEEFGVSREEMLRTNPCQAYDSGPGLGVTGMVTRL
ncbi:MAG: phosphoenolpyruvate carboxylase [Verrucomicrobia bacterium]|nr:phosphoenolpyruvate carboxylase [Verrucomicrobiota bacterium]